MEGGCKLKSLMIVWVQLTPKFGEPQYTRPAMTHIAMTTLIGLAACTVRYIMCEAAALERLACTMYIWWH